MELVFNKELFNTLNSINNTNIKNNDVSINNISNNDISINNISNNDVSINDISANDISIIDISNNEINEEEISKEEELRISLFEKNLTFELNDPYYYIIKDALSKELCKKIIDMFEDSEKHEGKTIKGINFKTKKTLEVNIRGEKWQEIDNFISSILTKAIIEYSKKINILTNNNYIIHCLSNNVTDTGYQVQKYIKNDGFYKWHQDFIINNTNSFRLVTFLFYLNDVEEGGETFFYNGKVKPEAGKLLLFPATWTYNHKGNMPISNDKYIITGWFSN